MKRLTNRGYVVPKECLSSVEKRALVNALSVSPTNYFTNGLPVRDSDKFKVYRESEHRYRVPRFFGMESYGPPDVSSLSEGTTVDYTFAGTLKQELNQHIACNTIISKLKTVGGSILSLPTGYGKTTCALYIISQLKKKTLIIVHKEFLMSQWTERIRQFLPNASIGIIRQNKIDIDTKDIVIAMLQSLSMKDYDHTLFNSFGLTVIDEAHHVCSKTFSQALLLFSSKYVLGLSATPERKDGLTCVLHWFLGNIDYKVERSEQTGVHIYKHVFQDDLFDTPAPVSATGSISIPSVVTALCNSDTRNEALTSIIVALLLQKRKLIILSDRRLHCELLKESVEQALQGEYTCGLYLGGMKQAQLKENEACNAIFATYSLANEGLDIPALNTLVMATPKTDVVQACGRILRETGTKTLSPVIVDFVDDWPCLHNQYRKRQRFYKSTGFNILSLKDKLDLNSI